MQGHQHPPCAVPRSVTARQSTDASTSGGGVSAATASVGGMAAFRSPNLTQVISALREALARKGEQVGELLESNTLLRVRWTALQLIIRIQEEISQHRTAIRALREREAQTGRQHQFTAAEAQQSAAGRGGGGEGGAEGEGESWPGPSARVLASMDGGLLGGLPHLAPGQSLMHLDSITVDDAARIEVLTLQQAHQLWKPLVEEALVYQVSVMAGQAAGPLEAIGIRITRFQSSLCLWNYMLYAQFQATHMTNKKEAGAMNDAPLSHWEKVLGAIKLTRLQALLIVEITKLSMSRVKALRTERLRLLRQLGGGNSGGGGLRAATTSSGASAAAGAGPGGLQTSGGSAWPASASAAVDAAREQAAAREAEAAAAAAWGCGEQGVEERLALMEELEVNVMTEGSELLLSAQASRAVMSPQQIARLFSLSYPYPVNQMACVSTLEHALKFTPEFFAPSL